MAAPELAASLQQPATAVESRLNAGGHDFEAMVADHTVWELAPALMPEATFLPPAPTGFGPPPTGFGTVRARCAVCGEAYPVPWSIQVREGAVTRQLTVCATTPRCSPPSLVPPVRVGG